MKKRIASLLLAVLMICAVMSAMAVTAFAKEDVKENQPSSDSDIVFEASVDAFPDDAKGSAMSEGSLTIIVGVGCLAIGLVGGLLIGKKKSN